MKTVMITRAGYLKQTGFAAIDDEGSPHEITELMIHGTKFAIRLDDLRDTLERHQISRIEKIFQNWQQYLGGIAGLVKLSKSGRALVIEMVDGGKIHGAGRRRVFGTLPQGVVRPGGETPGTDDIPDRTGSQTCRRPAEDPVGIA